MEFIEYLALRSIGDIAAVEICALSEAVALELLKAPLVVFPFVRNQFAARYTSHRNNHLLLNLLSSIFWLQV